jgi:hypothetical protein
MVALQSSVSSSQTANLALLVAALAVFVGPFVQMWIAKRQVRATVLSANRQRWIDSLRSQIAEFLAALVTLNAVRSGALDLSPTEYSAKLEQFRLRQFTIRLMLNPSEKDHQRLDEILREGLTLVTSPKPCLMQDDLAKVLDAIDSIARPVLKREWERVKLLK